MTVVSCRVLAATEEEIQRFSAILDREKAVGQVVPLQRPDGQLRVLRVVLDQQDVHRFRISHGHAPFC